MAKVAAGMRRTWVAVIVVAAAHVNSLLGERFGKVAQAAAAMRT
jgi:hypothetical protein